MRLAGSLTLLALLLPAAVLAGEMAGNPIPQNGGDDREIVPLTGQESAAVATEMRQMLASVQEVTGGLARGDMQAVAEGAAKSGPAMMKEVSPQIREKFPLPFMEMGKATHQAFAGIAQEAKAGKNATAILTQLSTAEQYCVACHAAYRFAPLK